MSGPPGRCGGEELAVRLGDHVTLGPRAVEITAAALELLRRSARSATNGGGAALTPEFMAVWRVVTNGVPAGGGFVGETAKPLDGAGMRLSGQLPTRGTVLTGEVAETLGITPQAVRKMCRRGDLPALLVEGRWLIEEDEFLALVALRQKATAHHERSGEAP